MSTTPLTIRTYDPTKLPATINVDGITLQDGTQLFGNATRVGDSDKYTCLASCGQALAMVEIKLTRKKS